MDDREVVGDHALREPVRQKVEDRQYERERDEEGNALAEKLQENVDMFKAWAVSKEMFASNTIFKHQEQK